MRRYNIKWWFVTYQMAARGMTIVPNQTKKKDATLEYEMVVREVRRKRGDVVTMFPKIARILGGFSLTSQLLM